MECRRALQRMKWRWMNASARARRWWRALGRTLVRSPSGPGRAWLGRACRCLGLLAVAALIVVRPVRFLIVTGSSMAPALSPGDLAVVVRRLPLAPGDIACFADGSGLVCHRLVWLGADGWATKGDANEAADRRAVPAARTLGKVVFSVRSAPLRDVAAQVGMGYHRLQAGAWP
jgi:hypothetical protein